MKICTKCGSEGEFYKAKYTKDGLDYYCKNCRKDILKGQGEARRKWRENSQTQESKKQQKRRALKSWCKFKYNITLEEYDALHETQKTCAICKKEPPKNKKLSVDHNHKTGKVRKLLCHSCNLLIGYAYENTETLKSAITYLEAHSE